MTTASQTVAARAGEPLDALVWRTIGKGSGALERVLEANAGVADLGPFLPEGTAVFIPGDAAASAQADVVQLWD